MRPIVQTHAHGRRYGLWCVALVLLLAQARDCSPTHQRQCERHPYTSCGVYCGPRIRAYTDPAFCSACDRLKCSDHDLSDYKLAYELIMGTAGKAMLASSSCEPCVCASNTPSPSRAISASTTATPSPSVGVGPLPSGVPADLPCALPAQAQNRLNYFEHSDYNETLIRVVRVFNTTATGSGYVLVYLNRALYYVDLSVYNSSRPGLDCTFVKVGGLVQAGCLYGPPVYQVSGSYNTSRVLNLLSNTTIALMSCSLDLPLPSFLTSASPSTLPSISPSITTLPSISLSRLPSLSLSLSLTPLPTISVPGSLSLSLTPIPTVLPSITPIATTLSLPPILSRTSSPTQTATSATSYPSASSSQSPVRSSGVSVSRSNYPSASPSSSVLLNVSASVSTTFSVSATSTPTTTSSASLSRTVSATISPSVAPSPSPVAPCPITTVAYNVSGCNTIPLPSCNSLILILTAVRPIVQPNLLAGSGPVLPLVPDRPKADRARLGLDDALYADSFLVGMVSYGHSALVFSTAQLFISCMFYVDPYGEIYTNATQQTEFCNFRTLYSSVPDYSVSAFHGNFELEIKPN